MALIIVDTVLFSVLIFVTLIITLLIVSLYTHVFHCAACLILYLLLKVCCGRLLLWHGLLLLLLLLALGLLLRGLSLLLYNQVVHSHHWLFTIRLTWLLVLALVELLIHGWACVGLRPGARLHWLRLLLGGCLVGPSSALALLHGHSRGLRSRHRVVPIRHILLFTAFFAGFGHVALELVVAWGAIVDYLHCLRYTVIGLDHHRDIAGVFLEDDVAMGGRAVSDSDTGVLGHRRLLIRICRVLLDLLMLLGLVICTYKREALFCEEKVHPNECDSF